MNIQDIMSSPVTTIASTASLAEAAQQMLALEIGVLPVTKGGKVVGMLSDRDITIRAVAKGLDPAQTRVQQVMSTDVVSCGAASEVSDACKLMEDKQIRRLLVTDGKDAPVGIVSLGDVALNVRSEQSGEVLEKVSQPS